MRLVVVLVSILIGTLLAVQSRINGEMGRQLDDGYLAAVVSIASGLALLSLPVAGTSSGRAALRRWAAAIVGGDYPKWYFIGGAMGAVTVLAQGLAAAILGIALFSVALVAGQSLSGLVVDRRGLGTLRPQLITWPRLVGTVLMIAAVVWAVSGQLRLSGAWGWLLLPIAAGLLISFQQAINGQVRHITGSVLITTWANFAVALAVLLVTFVAHGLVAGWPTGLPTVWWMYLGGPLGLTFIACVAVFVHRIGVLLLGLCTTAGQLIGSLLIDLVVPPAGHTLAWTTVAGTVLALAAVGVTAIPVRTRAARRSQRRTPGHPVG